MKKTLTAWAVMTVTAGSIFAFQVSRQFEVSPGGELKLEAREADVAVRLEPGSRLTLEVSGLAESDLEISRDGNLIRIVQNRGGGSRWSDASFKLVVPPQFNLDLLTRSGDVTIAGDLEGALKAETRGGDIEFDNVRGEVDLNTFGGDIEGGDVAGNSVVRTMGGDIELGTVGGSLEAATQGGDIEVDRAGGSLKARTMGGDITVGDVDAEAELSTLGGDIAVGHVASWASLDTKGGDIELAGANGEVTAKTAGGDIDLEDVRGSVDAQTAGGDIQVELDPSGSQGSRLASKGGDIVLYLSPGARATVEAQIKVQNRWKWGSDSYEISSDFPAESHQRDPKTSGVNATYRINGGGPTIQIETVNGNVQIRSSGQ